MINTNSIPLFDASQEKKPLFPTNNSTFSSKGRMLYDPSRDKKGQPLRISEFFKKALNPSMSSEELIEFFKNMCFSKLMAFNHLIWLLSQGMPIEPSQKHVGDVVDVGRQQINKHFGILKRCGFIDIYTRGMEKTAVYRIAPIFYKPETWHLLQDYVPVFKSLALGFFSFSALLSRPSINMGNSSQSPKVTLLNIKPSNIYIYSNTNIEEEENSIFDDTGPEKLEREHNKMASFLDRLKSYLHLDRFDLCELMAFPFEVLYYVDQVNEQGKKFQGNAYAPREFIQQCKDRCSQMYIEPNYQAVRDMQFMLIESEEQKAIQEIEQKKRCP